MEILFNHFVLKLTPIVLLFTGPPYFTKSPQNITVKAGEDVMLPCVAKGDPPPKLRWLRVGPGFPIDGVPLDLPDFKALPEGGLFLKHVLPSQDGFYECQAISVVGTNSIGNFTSFSIFQRTAPSIERPLLCLLFSC